MRNCSALIVERDDLFQAAREKDFKHIKFSDIAGDIRPLYSTGLILFVDTDGKTKIIKNSYGDCD